MSQLSCRSKAYMIQNLLQLDCDGSSRQKPLTAQQRVDPHGVELGSAPGLAREEIRESDHSSSAPLRFSHTTREPWCASCDAEYTSLCRHPSVITAEAQFPHAHHVQGVTMELCQADLWDSFHSLGTEMIITKPGRRMFPAIRVHIRGLEPDALYRLSLEFAQCGVNKYRYVYHSSRWMVAGLGEREASTASRTYVHRDSPQNGHTLMTQAVSFEKVKLTNSTRASSGQVCLSSMQKFQPKIHIEKVSDSEEEGSDVGAPTRMTFVFAQTSFMAVTAYQNSQITLLKINRNPFAKGFRDTSRSKNSMSLLRPLDHVMSSSVFNLPNHRYPNSGRHYSYTSSLDGYAPWKRPRRDVTPASHPEPSPPGVVTLTLQDCSGSSRFYSSSWDLNRLPPGLPLPRVPMTYPQLSLSPFSLSSSSSSNVSSSPSSPSQPVSFMSPRQNLDKEKGSCQKPVSDSHSGFRGGEENRYDVALPPFDHVLRRLPFRVTSSDPVR